jgi:hypothetical protein
MNQIYKTSKDLTEEVVHEIDVELANIHHIWPIPSRKGGKMRSYEAPPELLYLQELAEKDAADLGLRSTSDFVRNAIYFFAIAIQKMAQSGNPELGRIRAKIIREAELAHEDAKQHDFEGHVRIVADHLWGIVKSGLGEIDGHLGMTESATDKLITMIKHELNQLEDFYGAQARQQAIIAWMYQYGLGDILSTLADMGMLVEAEGLK